MLEIQHVLITDKLVAQGHKPDCLAAQEISELLDVLQSTIRDIQQSNVLER